MNPIVPGVRLSAIAVVPNPTAPFGNLCHERFSRAGWPTRPAETLVAQIPERRCRVRYNGNGAETNTWHNGVHDARGAGDCCAGRLPVCARLESSPRPQSIRA